MNALPSKPSPRLARLLRAGLEAALGALAGLGAIRPGVPGAATQEPLDSRTGLMQESALAKYGEPLLHKAQARSEPSSLLVFDFHDLDEVDVLYGAATRRELMRVIGRKLQRLAGAKGLAVRLDRTRCAVLLPGACRDTAMDLVTARIGKPCSFELEGAHDEVMVVPSLSVVSATVTTRGVAELLEQCRMGGAARRVENFRHLPRSATA